MGPCRWKTTSVLYLVLSIEFFSYQSKAVRPVRHGVDDHNSTSSRGKDVGAEQFPNPLTALNGILGGNDPCVALMIIGGAAPAPVTITDAKKTKTGFFGDCICPNYPKGKDNVPLCDDGTQLGRHKFFFSNFPLDIPPGCAPKCREIDRSDSDESIKCNDHVQKSVRVNHNIFNDCKCPAEGDKITQVGNPATGKTVPHSSYKYKELIGYMKTLDNAAALACIPTPVKASFICKWLGRFFGFFEAAIKGVGVGLDNVQRASAGILAITIMSGTKIATITLLSLASVALAFMATAINTLKVLNAALCTGDKCTGINSLILVGFGIFGIIMFFNPIGAVTGSAFIGLAIVVSAYLIRRNGANWCKQFASSGVFSSIKSGAAAAWSHMPFSKKKSAASALHEETADTGGTLNIASEVATVDGSNWGSAKADANQALGLNNNAWKEDPALDVANIVAGTDDVDGDNWKRYKTGIPAEEANNPVFTTAAAKRPTTANGIVTELMPDKDGAEALKETCEKVTPIPDECMGVEGFTDRDAEEGFVEKPGDV